MNAIVTIPRARAFDQGIADDICDSIAQGASLAATCERLKVSASSISRWLQNVDTFASSYAYARRAHADFLADSIVPLAGEARTAASAHEVQAIKLDVDARKWAASKFNPTAYGDKLDVTSKGEALAAPSHQIDARVQSIIMQAEQRRLSSLSHEALSLLD